MQLATRIRSHLEKQRKNYAVIPHAPTQTLGEAATAVHIDPRHLARAVLLQDSRGLLLAVLPSNHLIDFHALRELLGCDCKPAPAEQVVSVFSDCEAGCVPPLGEPYGVPVVIDKQFAHSNPVHFEAGYHHSLVRMQGSEFQALHHAGLQAAISRPLSVLESRDVRDFMLPGELDKHHPLTDLRPLEDIRRQIERIDRLPAMPEMANRLLRLHNNPKATIDDLTNIIQADPSLTAQVIRYARSAFFGYHGKVESLTEAVTRVLGFDTVFNMALGLAASRTFHNPADGPLGLQAFWRHATYSAALAQTLANAIGPRLPLKPGLAYLVGLLHNFGFLLAGHLFRAEFFLLNRVVAANPQIPVPLIERRVLGIEHTQIGAWLMSAWNMPEAVTLGCREHHNEFYAGDQAEYVHLMLCVDHLLRAHGIGDGADGAPPTAILNALGLDLDKARQITEKLLESTETLDAMARQLAAA
ncbi:MAG: HDOD domain-containing protein [Gammaproteobacteria bacterium]|nr:HDOD domain-containing protein [Gammaproteobacteria bacterium]